MKRAKVAVIWFVLVALLITLYLVSSSQPPLSGVPFDEFLGDVAEGRVQSVRIDNNELTVTLHEGGYTYQTLGVVDESLQQDLSDQGALIQWGSKPQAMRMVLTVGLPLVLLLAFFVYFLRKAQAGTGNILSLAKSRHRVITGAESSVTFADVGGCEEAKELLRDVIDFLKHPQKWHDAGARLPRGVLLEGPPGSGKTLIARAVAGETNAHFFLISASEFVEMFVGVGAARVRDLFETASKQAPAVIFIDELDAVGRRRGSGIGAGHDEREQTLNQLLVSLDGFQANDRVVVIGATNRPDVLDPALLRSGRFDRRIKMPSLTEAARLEILRIHTRTKPLAPELALDDIARSTPNLSGAQLENLANEAALRAVRRARINNTPQVVVTTEDFQQALIPLHEQDVRFNKLDSVLIESACQLAEPTATTEVRLTLKDAVSIEGELVWADASFVKLRENGRDSELLIPKAQVLRLEALSAAPVTLAEEIGVDRWATRQPGLA